jgi:hypothetical protein
VDHNNHKTGLRDYEASGAEFAALASRLGFAVDDSNLTLRLMRSGVRDPVRIDLPKVETPDSN